VIPPELKNEEPNGKFSTLFVMSDCTELMHLITEILMSTTTTTTTMMMMITTKAA